MGSELAAAIHFTMHPSGVWTREGDVETYRGPCDTRVVITSGIPGLPELTHFAFHTVSLTRPLAPAPSSSSEEEDPEEGSTPPSSPQIMPMTQDVPESSHLGAPYVLDQTYAHPVADQYVSPWLHPEGLSSWGAARFGMAHIDWSAEMSLPQYDLTLTSERTPPLAVLPISATPFYDAHEQVLPPEPEYPHHLTDESEELEMEFAEDVPEPVEGQSPVYIPADYPSEEEEEDAVPDFPEYIPGAEDFEDEDADEEIDGFGFGDIPDFVDFEDGAEWELDDGGDFPLDSDDEMISCVTSERSSSSSDLGPGW